MNKKHNTIVIDHKRNRIITRRYSCLPDYNHFNRNEDTPNQGMRIQDKHLNSMIKPM